MGFRTAQRLAKAWGSRFADAGISGHINADSQLGDWQFGQFLLGQLLKRPSPVRQDAVGDGAATGGASRYAHGREALPVETPAPPGSATSGPERHEHH
jgi:hypothetical protein